MFHGTLLERVLDTSFAQLNSHELCEMGMESLQYCSHKLDVRVLWLITTFRDPRTNLVVVGPGIRAWISMVSYLHDDAKTP